MYMYINPPRRLPLWSLPNPQPAIYSTICLSPRMLGDTSIISSSLPNQTARPLFVFLSPWKRKKQKQKRRRRVTTMCKHRDRFSRASCTPLAVTEQGPRHDSLPKGAAIVGVSEAGRSTCSLSSGNRRSRLTKDR